MSNFSTRLGRLRTARGWTLGELARRAGVDKGNLSRLEDGTAKAPTLETARRLAKALRVPLPTLADAPWATLPIRVLDPAVVAALGSLHVVDPGALIVRLAALDPAALDLLLGDLAALEAGTHPGPADPAPARRPVRVRVLGGYDGL